MDKRGGVGELLYDNIIYLVLLVVFTAFMFAFLWQQSSGASLWEQYYAAEITRALNFAHPGDELRIDVQSISELARRNKVDDLNSLFSYDNSKNEICIQLNVGRKTCLQHVSNLDIVDQRIEFGVPGNVLVFSVIEKGRIRG